MLSNIKNAILRWRFEQPLLATIRNYCTCVVQYNFKFGLLTLGFVWIDFALCEIII